MQLAGNFITDANLLAIYKGPLMNLKDYPNSEELHELINDIKKETRKYMDGTCAESQ